MRRTTAALALAFFPLTACRACPPRAPRLPMPGEMCASDAECVAPFTCQHPEGRLRDAWIQGDDRGMCTRACTSSAECGAGRCRAGLCESPPPSPIQEIYALQSVEHPAPIEVSPWVQGAAGWRFEPAGTRGSGSVGAGLDLTFGLATFFPSGYGYYRSPKDDAEREAELPRDPQQWSDASHLRAGPWVAFETPFDRARGEGGLVFTVGGKRVVSLATFGLRGGVGYSSAGIAHAIGQLSWGVRYVRMRRYDPHPTACKPLVATASGLRLFSAVRRELDAAARTELTFGIEWEPLGRGLGVIPCLER
jgi:hypothetical protein